MMTLTLPLSRRLIFAGMVVLLVVLFWLGWSVFQRGTAMRPLAPGEWSLQPITSDSTGVAVTSDFVLRAGSGVDASRVQSMLHVTPAAEFVATRRSGTEALVHFTKPLKENTVYSFRLTEAAGTSEAQGAETVLDPAKSRSWAFQTQNPFRVTQTLPADRATGVPTDTGIEMTWSAAGVTPETLEKFFEISPKVEGRFETHEKTSVFVPKSLEPGTVYTVTVRKGIAVEGGVETLKEDKVFHFETKPKEDVRVSGWSGFVRESYESSTIIKPAVDMYIANSNQAGNTARVRVLRAPDEASFLSGWSAYRSVPSWASYSRDAFRFKTDDWAEAAKFTTPLHVLTNSASAYIEFPQTLPEGQYVLEVEIGAGGTQTKTLQTVLQVSDISAFISTSEEKMVVWANDVATKQPIQGAEAVWSTDRETSLGKTNDQGLLTVDTPEALRVVADKSVYSFVKIRRGDGQELIMPMENNTGGDGAWWYRTAAGDDYWSYLSFDRELYQPTDSVGFWGVVRDRRQMNRSVPLTLVAMHGDDEVWRQAVTPSKTGTFTGEMKLDHWDTGSYHFEVRVGDTVIMTKYVNVETYTKPAYRLSLEADRKAIFAGEALTANGLANFFEGTPVPQANIVMPAHPDSVDVIMPDRTDNQGKFSIRYTPKEPKQEYELYGSGPGGSTQSIDVASAEAEEGDISASTFVRIFGSRLGFDLDDTKVQNGRATFSGTVRQVVLDRLNDGMAKDEQDYWGDVKVHQVIRVKATRTVWEKVEKGEEYDFVEKKVVKRYDWKSHDETLDDTTVTTDDQGRFTYQPTIDAHSVYQVSFQTTDDHGNATSVSTYAYGDESSTNGDAYTLRDQLDASAAGEVKNYHVGEAMRLVVAKGGQPVASGEGRRFLYLREQNGIREAAVSEQPEYATNFSEADVPNVTIVGVYFTGETYVTIPDFSATFEKKDRQLTVQVTPNKTTYRPRDEVRVRVKTTDPDGKPKPAEVNLSVVDEALFALSEQYINPLAALYTSVGDGVLSTYVSHQYPAATQLAERGGGGDARSVFPDRAFFGSVTTDSNGQGEFVFKVPDNLTSWRLTAQGVSADLFAGFAKGTIAVKQPFFVDLVLAKEYLESDQPIVGVRAYGEGLQPGQLVEYTVTGDASSGLPSQTLTGKAFETTDIPLPKLVEGKHTVTITGRAGDLTDTLVRDYAAVKTRLEKQRTMFTEVSSGAVIGGSDTGRTRIVLGDAGRGQWYGDLVEQATGTSDRVDRRLARERSRQLLQTYFNEGIDADPIDWKVYQDMTDGGIKLLPYGESDFGLSVRVAFAEPEGIDTTALTKYLEGYRSPSSGTPVSADDQARALAALGALHQPVLLDLQRSAKDTFLSEDARVAIGIGLAILGDEDTARQVYASIQGIAKNALGERWFDAREGMSPNASLATTASLAELSGLLGLRETAEYVRYLDQHPSKEISVDLERIVAIAPTLSQVKQSAVSFDYTLNGQTVHKTLERNETFALSLTPDERQALNLRNIQGTLGAVASFAAPWQPTDDAKGFVELEREFSVDGRVTTELHVGDRVRVTLRPSFGANAPDGCYRVTDALPSGLKGATATPWAFSGFNWNQEAFWYPYSVTGQKVSFCITKDIKKPITYSARVVGKGVFSAEGAVIQSEQDPSIAAASAMQTIKITE